VKVFISSDMEGTAGVVDWSQCLPGHSEYEHYRALLQGEVNAAIDGAQRAGADEFLVNDSHSTMQNLRPDTLAGAARYLSGRHKPMYMMQGLDGTSCCCPATSPSDLHRIAPHIAAHGSHGRGSAGACGG
jgi:D-amino peptidase